MTLKDIDLAIVNPFLIAAYDVFKKLFSVEIRKGAVILKENPTASYEIAIIIGVSGHKYTGVVVYSMKKTTAINLINSFDSDFKVDSADETFPDALGEVANIISGNAVSEFSQNNIMLKITTPSVIIGEAFEVHLLDQTTLSTDMITPFGELEINVAIKKF